MDGDITTPGGMTVPASSLTWRFSRGSGPGGQSVNTTDSRVELVVDLSALVAADVGAPTRVRSVLGDTLRIVVTTERSQLRNREEALERLAGRLDAAARAVPPRLPTRRTLSSVRDRLDTKRHRSRIKSTRADAGDDA
jgi:ribosome-associated protein